MLIMGQSKINIICLKNSLSKSFAMKDLGPTKHNLGMKVIRDCSKKLIWPSQEKYIEKVLKTFNMDKAKPVSVPLAEHFQLSTMQCSTSEEEKKEMSKMSYSSAVGSLMYVMICTRPDIAHAVDVVSRFLSNHVFCVIILFKGFPC